MKEVILRLVGADEALSSYIAPSNTAWLESTNLMDALVQQASALRMGCEQICGWHSQLSIGTFDGQQAVCCSQQRPAVHVSAASLGCFSACSSRAPPGWQPPQPQCPRGCCHTLLRDKCPTSAFGCWQVARGASQPAPSGSLSDLATRALDLDASRHAAGVLLCMLHTATTQALGAVQFPGSAHSISSNNQHGKAHAATSNGAHTAEALTSWGAAGVLAGIARSHSTPLTRAFASPDLLQRLLACAFAPAVCVQVRTAPDAMCCPQASSRPARFLLLVHCFASAAAPMAAHAYTLLVEPHSALPRSCGAALRCLHMSRHWTWCWPCWTRPQCPQTRPTRQTAPSRSRSSTPASARTSCR